ncbi:MAG: flagellar basal body-associated FliL family protein [Burkholderiales bacterium]|nr:flagellar basal body-associated FliL family protein [Burkholderiales bacterium]
MSTVVADAGAAPPAKGRKKLILVVAALLVLLALAAAAALLLLKSRASAEDDADADAAQAHAPSRAPLDAAQAPAYVPLDAFTVNLADRDADRYAQVAVVLELADPGHAEAIKAFMPAVRNNILMVLAHKTARELMERDGKQRLAEEIRRETARALGMEVGDAADEDAGGAERPAKRRARAPVLPVRAVHFATFIVQ